jgi:tRNA uridine 5-carboxymethylaminomethyl modification enzyme
MFTARAEYRLILRQDNCDERLMPKAFEIGIVSRETLERRQTIWKQKEELKEKLHKTLVLAETWNKKELGDIKENTHADKLLKRPNVTIFDVAANSDLDLSGESAETLLAAQSDILYEGFVLKQKENVEKTLRFEETKIPKSLNFNEIAGLSNESREKLNRHRPQTIGQSLRISGVSPADVSVILVYLSQKSAGVSRETS